MIIYLASYPRSGNSLLREIIHKHFHHATTNIHETGKLPQALKFTSNWRMPGQGDKLKRWWLVWNQWMALYDTEQQKNRRFLMHGCQSILNRPTRLRLSLEKNIFFLKTHHRPFRAYFPGEFVIHITRHPGPIIRSYYNLYSKSMGDEFHYSVEDFITGNVHNGSWTAYMTHWLEAAENQLKGRNIFLKYEETSKDVIGACQKIADAIGLPYMEEAKIRSFSNLKESDNAMFGFGSNENWESFYNPEQLDLLYRTHGVMAKQLGFMS